MLVLQGMVADLVKSALMRNARLMNSRLKGPKRMMTSVVALLKKDAKEDLLPTNVRSTRETWEEK